MTSVIINWFTYLPTDPTPLDHQMSELDINLAWPYYYLSMRQCEAQTPGQC